MYVDSEVGVQIVRVSVEHAYHLDEDALASLLLREDVVDSPVALVSVAGAFRGGKSFLLNFFLRYLLAEPESRENGSWLGKDDEPLSGFSWRGGAERNTTGLLFWSRPVHIELPSGEPVTVLLMDTQGTFDSHSTVRDSSTIFALSTLLSSVQIYNLKENIKEDDLQHLQLFTEYGTLALESNNGLKPFQKLKFLVRDWTFPYEHPYGAAGGRQLLAKRLQTSSEQHAELHELRQHIMDCFNYVGGFLMPHPGSAISRPDFNGCLFEIESEFKTSLLELVPSIFGPSNLTPKLVNGGPVTGRDLFHYFKTYINIFNSNDLPHPKTIMRATAEAAMLSAMEDARARYHNAMERVCCAELPCVTPPALRRQHALASDTARQAFTRRRAMGNKQDIQTRADQLTKELDDKLSQYELINEAKCQKLFAETKKVYEEFIQNITKRKPEKLCLHPLDLEEIQSKAVDAAMVLFDSKRTVSDDEDSDNEKNLLLKDLEERGEQLRSLNEANNNAAVLEARKDYDSYIDSACGDQPCMNPLTMQLKHEEARGRAVFIFKSKRIRIKDHYDDIYVSHLNEDIDKQFQRLYKLNENNNKSTVQTAIFNYTKYMTSVCASHLPCLHPSELEQEHKNAQDRAVGELCSRRKYNGKDDYQDEHKEHLLQEVARYYEEYFHLNEANNLKALSAAYDKYCSSMDAACGEGRTKLSSKALAAAHKYAVKVALQFFLEQRRGGKKKKKETEDDHQSNLNQKVDDRLMHYEALNERNRPAMMDSILSAFGGSANASRLRTASTVMVLIGVVGAAFASLMTSKGSKPASTDLISVVMGWVLAASGTVMKFFQSFFK